jgi:hypothetical protein
LLLGLLLRVGRGLLDLFCELFSPDDDERCSSRVVSAAGNILKGLALGEAMAES